jgi:RNA polymerase sigma-70 factor (ECF subfamily)
MSRQSPAKLHVGRVEPLYAPDEGVSDADLVIRARGGDGWALEMLYRRHVQLVGAAALRLLRNRSETEDVVQETFLLAFEKLDQLSEPSAFRSWLVRIAISRVHRRYRARKWRSLFRIWSHHDENENVSFESEASENVSPEQHAELALLDRELSLLSIDLRTAWILRHVLGCSLEEAAEACGCSLATVKRRIAAADKTVGAHLRSVE